MMDLRQRRERDNSLFRAMMAEVESEVLGEVQIDTDLSPIQVDYCTLC